MSSFTSPPVATETLDALGGGTGLAPGLASLDSRAGTNDTAVALNTTHRGSDGTDHSNVVLNDTHRGSDGSDHTFIDQSVISGATPTLTNTNFTEATNKNYVTDAQQTVIGNTSGTNTGDEAAASVTVAGVSELATTAEIDTGTDSTRAIPVDQFVASDRNIRFVDFAIVSVDDDVATGTTLIEWVAPFTGTIIQSDTDANYFMAWNAIAGTTGTMVVDIHLGGTTIMTTNKLDIETGEKTTASATTQPDLTTTAITAGDIITIDVDAVHTTPAKGLTVRMAIRLT